MESGSGIAFVARNLIAHRFSLISLGDQPVNLILHLIILNSRSDWYSHDWKNSIEIWMGAHAPNLGFASWLTVCGLSLYVLNHFY